MYDYQPINHCFPYLLVQYKDVRQLWYIHTMALWYLFSFDIMDSYHHVAINLQYTDWLQFDIDSEVFTNNCLNFS